MKILSVGNCHHEHAELEIENISEDELDGQENLSDFGYVIINGGDGTLRRVVSKLRNHIERTTLILNPTGSFNVVAKMHSIPKVSTVLDQLARGDVIKTEKQDVFSLNEHLFFFSAGNMGDLLHIVFSEILRFGFLQRGVLRYGVSLILLGPLLLAITPFMFWSARRFFIFTPFKCIKRFGNFYGQVKPITITFENGYNLIELDGDIVTIQGKRIDIGSVGQICIVSR